MKRRRLLRRSGATRRDSLMRSHHAPTNQRGLPPSPMTSNLMRRARVRQTSVETLKDSLIMSRPSLPPTPQSSTRSHPVPIPNRKEVHQVKLLALLALLKERSTMKHRRSSRRAQDASAGDRRRTRTRARKKEATTMTTSSVARLANQMRMRHPRTTPPMPLLTK